MATVLGDLEILLTATDQGFTAALETAAGKFTKFAKVISGGKVHLGALGTAMIGAGAGVVGLSALIGGTAVDAAAKFQAEMTKTGNNAGMSAGEIAQMSQQILGLSSATGATNTELAEGYMHIYDMGYKGADAMNVLTWATKEALATGASVADTANMLATTMHEFNMPAKEAANTMDQLHAAAAASNTTMASMVQAFGPVGAQAAAMGIPFNQAAAAMAALTRNGFDAQMSATQVRDMLLHMMAPTKASEAELQKLSNTVSLNTGANTKYSQQLSTTAAELQIAQERVAELSSGHKTSTLTLTNENAAITKQNQLIAETNQKISAEKEKIAGLNPLNKKYGTELTAAQDRLATLNDTLQQHSTQLSIDQQKLQLLNTGTGVNNITLQQAKLRVTELQQKMETLGQKAGLTTNQVQGLSGSGVDLVYDFSAAGLKAKGLTGVLADLKKATGGNAEEMNKLIPNLRGGLGALVLTGKGSKDVTDILNKMKGSLGSTQAAYSLYSATTEAQTKKMTQNFHNMMIAIGTGLIPSLNRIIGAITPILQKFAVWAEQNPKVVDSILEIMAATGGMMIITGIVLKIIAAFKALKGILDGIKWAGNVAKNIADFARLRMAAFTNAAQSAAAWVKSAATSAAAWVQSTATTVGAWVKLQAQAVVAQAKVAAQWLASAAKSALAWTASTATTIGQFVLLKAQAMLAAAQTGAAWLAANAKLLILNATQLIVRGATATWTAAQWLLNAALDANPIGIVVLAIAGLAAGIVYAYQHSQIFRDIVNGLWNDFKSFVGWISSTFMNVLKGIGDAATNAGKLLKNLDPFVRHSPSLVDQVTNGVAEIKRQYESLNQMQMPNLAAAMQLTPGTGASSVTNSTYNAGNTNTVSMTNTFNVPSSATADNVTSYLALQLEHAGIV